MGPPSCYGGQVHRSLLLPLLACLGCKGVDDAPSDIEGLLHFFWSEFDGEEDALAVGLDNLHVALGNKVLEDPLDGNMTSLKKGEISPLNMKREVDPSEAVGMFIASEFDCHVRDAVEIVTAPNQEELYDIYDDYQRDFDGNRKAFLDEESAELGWTTVYTVSIPLSGQYTATVLGSARWIEGADSGGFLITRSHLPKAAEWDKDNPVFDQDYRIEIYYSPKKGKVRHFEGLWRHMKTATIDTDDTNIQRFVLNGLADWDEQTAEWCAEGMP